MLNPLRKFAISAACKGSTINSPARPSCKNLRIHARSVCIQHLLDGRGNAALIVVQRYRPAALFQVVGRVPHDHRMAGKGQHLDVVVIVPDGHDLGAVDAAIVGPALQRVSLRATDVQNIKDGQVARVVLCAQQRKLASEVAGEKLLLGTPHQLNWPAEHGLDGIFGQRPLDGADVLNVRRVLLHPALDDAVETLVVLADDSAHAFAVEGQHRMLAKLAHMLAQLDGRFSGQKVPVKEFAASRACHGAIGADETELEAERFRDGQGEFVPATSDQCNLHASVICPAQGIQVGRGDLDLGIQQRAININGDEADGALHPSILAAASYRIMNGIRPGRNAAQKPAKHKLFAKLVALERINGCKIAATKWNVGPTTASGSSL